MRARRRASRADQTAQLKAGELVSAVAAAGRRQGRRPAGLRPGGRHGARRSSTPRSARWRPGSSHDSRRRTRVDHRPEVRRDLGRLGRAHPACRRAHHRVPGRGQRGRGRRLGHGRGDRPPRRSRPSDPAPPGPARDGRAARGRRAGFDRAPRHGAQGAGLRSALAISPTRCRSTPRPYTARRASRTSRPSDCTPISPPGSCPSSPDFRASMRTAT